MGKLKNGTFLVLFFLCSANGLAQTQIKGKVMDSKDKKSMIRAIVKLIQVSNDQILAYAQTNKDGEFAIKKRDNIEDCVLEFSHIGYTTVKKNIPSNNYIEVLLKENNVQLKEVVITPDKIRQNKDTITYVVSAFATASDRTIEDVIKKMPGIEVSENGEIKYQGQKLNKFYIENGDLLGGRYALATQNISHKNVASVEVLENHQPIKALEDIGISTSPAMNIKLKEDAKLKWVGTIKVGVGTPSLWNSELMGMRFRKKVQSFNTYKGNNTGVMSYDIQRLISDGDFGSWNSSNELSSYLDVKPSYASGIGSNRNRFDRTHTLTTNNLIKISKNIDLLPQLIASYKRETSDYNSHTTYFFDNDKYTIEEKQESSKAIQKSVEGQLQLKSNQPKSYFSNTLSFDLSWNDTDIRTLGTYPNIQAAYITQKRISNDFNILKRIDNKSITFKSINAYTSMPQNLKVTKNNNVQQHQDISLSTFFSKTSSEYGFYISKIRVKLDGELLYNIRWMNNTLDLEKNITNYQKIKSSFIPTLEYKEEVFSVSLQLPIFYQYQHVKDKTNNIVKIDPTIKLNYEPDSKWDYFLSAGYNTELPNEQLFYKGNILSNYRTMNSGYINFDLGNYYYASGGIKYKNTLKLFFADVNIFLSMSKSKKTSDQKFINDIVLYGYIPIPVSSKNIMIGGSVSKIFKWLKGTFSLRPSWSKSEKTIFRNDKQLPYNNQSFGINTKVNSNIWTWCDLNYNFNLFYNQNKINGEKSIRYTNFNQSFTVDFFLSKKVQIKYTIEHFNNQLDDKKHKNFVFSDITASYLMDAKWEFSCYVKNIFNQKKYSYFTENDLISRNQEYKIRGTDILMNATYRF